ncbi:MAG: helix-turn-helix transcriptional regulator [Gallionellales bacterium GWA2_60_18]|nr:MAG: helix-turn-helix transcriptional regulator [Gallionellales bacterium GWA2_60_18]
MNLQAIEHIHALWDGLADFDAARPDEALTHLMEGLCALAGAWNITWMGTARLDATFPGDPVKGWRPRIIRHMHSSPPLDDAVHEQVEKLEQGVVDITTIRNVEGAGTFRANRLRDMVGPEWFESLYYRAYYQNVGTADTVWVAFPVNEDAESWFGIHRALNCPPFTETERDTIAYALRGIKWFHRQLMLSHGLLLAATPMTQAERRVLHLLLSGRSEKLIAAELGRSYHTVHECVTAIFRKFGVNNRAALMALWLGQSA